MGCVRTRGPQYIRPQQAARAIARNSAHRACRCRKGVGRVSEGLTARIGWRIFSALDETKSGLRAGGVASSDLVKPLADSPDEPIQQMEDVCSFRAVRARAE